MVGVLLNSKGQVEHIIVGNSKKLYLPDIGRIRSLARRLRGLILIVVRPSKFMKVRKDLSCKLDHDFIIDLKKLRLDLVVQIEARLDGLAALLALAYVEPDYGKYHKNRCQEQGF